MTFSVETLCCGIRSSLMLNLFILLLSYFLPLPSFHRDASFKDAAVVKERCCGTIFTISQRNRTGIAGLEARTQTSVLCLR